MNLRNETQEILERVQQLTGNPVEVTEDESLAQMAQITRARSGVPFHTLRVNPSSEEPDYLVAYQCGFIVRLYQIPEVDRREFAGAQQGYEEAERLVKRAGQTAKLPDAAKSQLARQLIDGLLTQLRSYPIGMRIDHWLYSEYSGLRDQQQRSILRQLEDNLGVLKPEIRNFTPKPIYEANVSMNAAYAIFCDRLFGKSGHSIPYRSSGFEKTGRKLLKILESVPSEPEHDCELVDAWANELNLTEWYQWIPMRP